MDWIKHGLIYIQLMKYLFVGIVLVWAAMALSPEPAPTCSPPTVFFKEFPITLNEIQTFNVDDLFTGFNLQYNLSSSAPDFVHFRDKFKLTHSTPYPQKGLTSYHLEHRGNEWGKELITLSEEDTMTKIRWGFTSANDTVPSLTEEVTVENEKDIRCFDALLFRAKHLALVDCMKKVTFGYKNIFMYVNITSQTVIPRTVENDMYIPFTQVSRRRMFLYEENGYLYIVRGYFANSVGEHHTHNTYLEVMVANDPFKCRTLRVIDRSFLHEDKLSIMDFKVYYGSIYMLDYHNGVTVLSITNSQQISINGRYRTDSGFEKLGIYIGNLDHELIFALANNHAIYEVDFSNKLQPAIIAKYNLMEGAIVTSLWVNREYVLTQITANVTDGKNESAWYNASLIFTRGTRTYLNAYAVVEHRNYRTIIEFSRAHNHVFIMDEETMNNYQLDTPILTVNPTSKDTMGQDYQFSVNGLSVNSVSGVSLACSVTMKFKVVDLEDRHLYPTGFDLPKNYYANYPGELFIPLDRYVIGSNITYDVKEYLDNKTGELSAHWVLQQNTTKLHWNRDPSFFSITFLRQEQYDSIDKTDLFIYTQDYTNKTHFVKCRTVPYTQDVNCDDDGHVPEISHRILNLTANRFHYYQGKHYHLAAVTFDTFPNEVFIYDVEAMEMFARPIILPRGYEGKIESIEFLGSFLVVVLRYTKEILFYDMIRCADIDFLERECPMEGKIDSIFMDEVGVKYFSPLQVVTSDYYPYILFIQNIDSVIILDITFPRPQLLAQIRSPGSMQPGIYQWKMAIAHKHLVLVNPPNIIEEHSLQELVTKKSAPMKRVYPLYHYTIPQKFDMDFSDQGDMIYITAEDKNMADHMNSVILVYRAGLPSVAVFYDVFHINGKYEDMLIDATGRFGDYVSVTMGSILMMFRQYEVPILVFDDNYNDFEFNLTYTNDPHNQSIFLSKSKVNIANFPDILTINDSRLNESDFLTSQVDYQNEKELFSLNDSNWFTGSVINYTVEGCDECGDKLKIRNHVEDSRDLLAEMDMDDYIFTINGGIIQQFQSMLSMQHNGSIDQYISMPAVHDGESCKHITYSFYYDFSISACLHDEEVYLYLTEFHSGKPFVNGPHSSSASAVAFTQMEQDLFMLVDVDEEPGQMSREGGVIIYALNHDPEDPEIFDELEFIDTTDLMSAQGWPMNKQVYISNAHFVYTNMSDTYRIAITEVLNGLFFVDFRWTRGKKSLEITKIEFYDMKEELLKHHLTLPNLAFFEAVAINHEFYDPLFRYWEVELIVTTRNFHIFEVLATFDKTGTLLYANITHVYYRYGYYETTNYLKVFDGYFAVVQKIPKLYEDYFSKSKQVLTVYDTRERYTRLLLEGDVPASYMMGGMPFPFGRITFDFNFTFVRNSSFPLRHIGLLVLHSRQATIREIHLHDNIGIMTEEGISQNQYAKFRANNDFSEVEIPLELILHNSTLPGWAIALIVIGCLLVAGIGGFVGWRWFSKRKPKSEIKKSLLEDEAKNGEEDDEEEDDEEEQEDEEEDEEEQSEEEEPKIPVAEVKKTEATKEPMSINRETVTSMDNIEEKREDLEEVEEKKEEE